MNKQMGKLIGDTCGVTEDGHGEKDCEEKFKEDGGNKAESLQYEPWLRYNENTNPRKTSNHHGKDDHAGKYLSGESVLGEIKERYPENHGKNMDMGAPMEVESIEITKITMGEEREKEILEDNRRDEIDGMGMNLNKKLPKEMDLGPYTYEWAESERPKNNYWFTNKNPGPKGNGAQLALSIIDSLEVSTKEPLLPQLETEPKEREENSRPAEEKLPKASR
ncbi:hypothetical protein U1Q18_012103 [Sarracenia purpurea var. burkii]